MVFTFGILKHCSCAKIFAFERARQQKYNKIILKYMYETALANPVAYLNTKPKMLMV